MEAQLILGDRSISYHWKKSARRRTMYGIAREKWTPSLCCQGSFGLILIMRRLEGSGAEIAERRVTAA